MNTIQLQKNEVLLLTAVFAMLPFIGFVTGVQVKSYNQIPVQPPIELSTQEVAEPQSEANTELAQTDEDPMLSTIEQEINSPITDSYERYDVQANVFTDFQNAADYKRALKDKGLDAMIAFGSSINGEKAYRVVLASFETRQKAEDYIEQISADNLMPLFIKVLHNDSSIQTASL